MSNASDGVTERVEWLVNGQPLFSLDNVTSWDDKPTFNTRSRTALGESGSRKRQDFVGHSGRVGIADGPDARWVDHFDAYTKARAANTPYVVTIVRSAFYPDIGERRTHRFDDCFYEDLDRSVQRGQDSAWSVSWTTGKPVVVTLR